MSWHALRTEDEEIAEALLRPLRTEPGIAAGSVDFLVARVAGALLVARLEGRRNREFEIDYERIASASWPARLRTMTGPEYDGLGAPTPTDMAAAAPADPADWFAGVSHGDRGGIFGVRSNPGERSARPSLEEAHATLSAAVDHLRQQGFRVWGWDDGSIVIKDGREGIGEELYIECPPGGDE